MPLTILDRVDQGTLYDMTFALTGHWGFHRQRWKANRTTSPKTQRAGSCVWRTIKEGE